MSDLATLRARRAEADIAYHKLMTGQVARVHVDQSGERVEFVTSNASRLALYIQTLDRQIAALEKRSSGGGPMGFIF